MRTRRSLWIPLVALAAFWIAASGCGQMPATPGTYAVRDPGFLHVSTPTRPTAGATPTANTIAFKFNGTAIPAGGTVWFSSVIKYSGTASLVPVVIHADAGTIQFTVNGVQQTVAVPAGNIVLSPTAALATTKFDAVTGTWTTVTPFNTAGAVFLTGVALPLPSGLPGGVQPVTWSTNFTCSTPNVSVSWQWAAAAYASFPGDLSTLNVKPIDDKNYSNWLNGDHAGTPEDWKAKVIGGATGGGGSNYTGGLSGTFVTVPVQGTNGPLSGTANIDGGKGGTLTVGRFTITVPAGAYGGSATIGISVTDQSVLQCDLFITPASANHFQVPVVLTSSYAGASVADPQTLVEVWFDTSTGVWRQVPGSSVDTDNQLVVAPLAHFSSYGVTYGRGGW